MFVCEQAKENFSCACSKAANSYSSYKVRRSNSERLATFIFFSKYKVKLSIKSHTVALCTTVLCYNLLIVLLSWGLIDNTVTTKYFGLSKVIKVLLKNLIRFFRFWYSINVKYVQRVQILLHQPYWGEPQPIWKKSNMHTSGKKRRYTNVSTYCM